jgi:hypothetical protein
LAISPTFEHDARTCACDAEAAWAGTAVIDVAIMASAVAAIASFFIYSSEYQ